MWESELIFVDNDYKESNLHEWGPGSREVYVLHFIISGRGCLQMGEIKYLLQQGDTFLIYPDTEIYYYPDPSDPWEYRWVDFRGLEADRLISLTGFTKEMPVMRQIKDVEKLFYIREQNIPKIMETERYRAKVHLLLSAFITEKEKPASVADQAIEYLHNYYWKTELTVEKMANDLMIERTYLFRLFKKTTGSSIMDYLSQLRMRRACTLLLETQMPIKSVACSVGYTDPLYFSRKFSLWMKCTPSQYRLAANEKERTPHFPDNS